MSVLQINVLGELQVARDGATVPLPPSKKTRALLAYLAVMGRPQRRERLCELFWDVPDDPRGALRWSLSKARLILNDDGRERLAADRNTVLLDTSDIDFDFAETVAIKPEEVESCSTDRLLALASRFRGAFLEDLQLPRCPEFEAWRVFHANRLDMLRLRTLRTVVERLADQPERALPHLHALRVLDPEDASLSARAEAFATAARQNARVRAAVAPPPVQTAEPEDLPASPPAGIAEEKAGNEQQQDIRFCKARDGVRLAFASSGEGPPILRAAHWMSHLQHDRNSPVWRHWIRELSRRNRLIQYDERCNGMSDWDADNVSFETMVSDLETIVQANGLTRFTLLGISQSCAVSVAYAVRHPEQVAGLILYGGYVKGWGKRGDPSEIATREALATLMRVGWGQNNPIFRQLFTSRFIPGANPEQIASFDELQRITVSPENAWRLQNMFGDIDVSDLLQQVRVPTLVIHGRGDQVAPFESGRAYATTIPGARLVELDTANHILLKDEPAFDVFLREVRAFATVQDEPALPPMEDAARFTELMEGRRQVTTLTCEIINPLSFLDYTDPEKDSESLEAVRAQALAVIERHGGTVVDAGYNEFTAAFGVRTASEDHALQACRAALELASMAEASGDGCMRARIGIDTGEAVVHSTVDGLGIEVSGAPATVSRRLVHALQRGIVAVTGRARDAAGGYVEASRLGRDEAPSFPPDWTIFELLAERRAVSRWLLRTSRDEGRLVGRNTEIDLLAEASRKVASGRGQVVALVGEAGLGKSRVAHEFLNSEEAGGLRLVECGALELDSRTPWAVVKNLVRSLFCIEQGDGTETMANKVLAGLGPDADVLGPPLLFVLDLPVEDHAWQALSAPGKARRVEEGTVQALCAAAERRPVAVLLEDLHWADAESLAVGCAIVEATRHARMLAIATSRPEGCPDWLARDFVWQIRLAPLSASATRDFVGSVLGPDDSVAAVGQLIAERTGGIPLFIEEMVRELVQSGRLFGERGAYRASEDVGDIAVPATVQSVIAARFAQLERLDRAVLEAGAVLSPDIRPEMLATLTELDPAALATSLSRLQRAGFLVEVIRPVRMLTFRHALMEEVVYSGILGKHRRKLHKRAFEALQSAEMADDAVERLAEHAMRAELWEVGARYLVRAGQKALLRSAHAAALAMVERGLAALTRLPQSTERLRLELELQKICGLAWMAARGWGSPEVGRACARAEELCYQLEDQSELFVVLRGRAQYYMIGGQPEAAQEVARRCQVLSDGTHDEGLRIETHHMLWTNAFFMGDYSAALDSASQACQTYRPQAHHHLTYQYSGHDPGVCCRCFAGMASWLRGDLEQATAQCRDAVKLAETLDHPLSTAIAYWGLAYLHLFQSEPEQVLHCAQREIEICDAYALPLIRSQGRFQQGWALAALGDLDAGIRDMSEGVDAIRATGAEMGLPYLLALLGQGVARRGDFQRALALIDDAIASARRNGARFQFSEILRLKAEVQICSGGDPSEAEALLRSAIRSAARQQAFLPELRAARDLARCLTDCRRASEARDLLAPYEGVFRSAASSGELDAATLP